MITGRGNERKGKAQGLVNGIPQRKPLVRRRTSDALAAKGGNGFDDAAPLSEPPSGDPRSVMSPSQLRDRLAESKEVEDEDRERARGLGEVLDETRKANGDVGSEDRARKRLRRISEYPPPAFDEIDEEDTGHEDPDGVLTEELGEGWEPPFESTPKELRVMLERQNGHKDDIEDEDSTETSPE